MDIPVHPVGAQVVFGPDEMQGVIENVTITRHGVVQYEVSCWLDGIGKNVIALDHDEVLLADCIWSENWVRVQAERGL